MHENEPYEKLYKNLSSTIGITASGVYAVLVGLYEFLERQNQLAKDGAFYITVPTLEKMTLLKRRKQENILQILEQEKLIKIERRGYPTRRFIKILPVNLSDRATPEKSTENASWYKTDTQLVQNVPTISTKRTNYTDETSQLYVQNVPTIGTKCTNYRDETYHNKEIINKEIIKKEIINKEKEEEKNISTIWQHYAGMINLETHQDIADAVTLYGEEWCKHAIDETKERNVKNWKYTLAILRDWAKKFPASGKPWEGAKNGRRKDNSKPILGNATSEQWANEPDELIL